MSDCRQYYPQFTYNCIVIIHFGPQSEMIVQDIDIMPSNLCEIFQDPAQRQRILKIIIQTLYNLGYEQSAAELEAESNISYFTPEVKAIKAALAQENYEDIRKILHRGKKYELVREVVDELRCLKLIRQGRMEEALLMIQNEIADSKKQAELSEELMMGTGQLKPDVLKKKHDFILERSFDLDISPNSMFKMISSYIELEKKGLTSGICPEFSLLRKPSASRRPPMRIVQTLTSNNIKNVQFIKFNRHHNKVLVVSATKKQKYLSIWSFAREKESLSHSKACSFICSEEIINVSWNHQQNELIALASHNHVYIFNDNLKVLHKKRISTGVHNSAKVLCVNWNIISNFLYVGGSFESIRVFGPSLEQIVTLQPFLRTRIINFNHEGTMMYAVSATKGLFVFYNLFQHKQEAQFVTEDVITTFRLENRDRNIILVTQRKILYLEVKLDQTSYNILHTFDNVYSENGLVEIEACLFWPWVVCLGQQEFLALGLDKEHKQQRWDSKRSFTFDISEGFMVSGEKELILWATGTFMDVMQEQEQEEEESSVMEPEEDNVMPEDEQQSGSSQENEEQQQSEHPFIVEDDQDQF